MILFSIETANFSLRFHLASTRKRLKTITFENVLQREQYENDAKTTCRYKTIVAFSSKMILFSIETANFSLRFQLPSTRKRLKTITFENGLQREQYENDAKTTCRCKTIVAFSSKMILFSIETANFSLRFHLPSTRKRLKTITFENVLQREQYENDAKTTCRCKTIVAFSSKTILFSIETANFPLRFHLASTRKRLKTITFETVSKENNMKTIRKRCVDAMPWLRFHCKRYRFR